MSDFWSDPSSTYFLCTNSEGSGETAWMCRLAWAFAGCLCDKYHNLMSWLNWPFCNKACANSNSHLKYLLFSNQPPLFDKLFIQNSLQFFIRNWIFTPNIGRVIAKIYQLSHLMTKPTIWHVCLAKISLGICPVWSVFAVRMKKA